MQNKTKFLNINANEWFFHIFLRLMGLSLAHENSDISKCKQDIRLLTGNVWNLFPLTRHFCLFCRSMGSWMTPSISYRMWSQQKWTVPQTTQYPSISKVVFKGTQRVQRPLDAWEVEYKNQIRVKVAVVLGEGSVRSFSNTDIDLKSFECGKIKLFQVINLIHVD